MAPMANRLDCRGSGRGAGRAATESCSSCGQPGKTQVVSLRLPLQRRPSNHGKSGRAQSPVLARDW